MRMWQALKALEEGKKVRLSSWIARDTYVCKETMPDYLDGLPINHIELCLNSEWEIYEEPPKTLSFAEVVEGLKQGKMYRRLEWLKDTSLLYRKCEWLACFTDRCSHISFSKEDFESRDWVEVKNVPNK